MTRSSYSPGRLLLGSALVILGVLFLFDQLGIFNADTLIAHWWPLGIIAIGIVQLMLATQGYVGPGIIILVGAVLLGETLDIYSVNVWEIIWPLIIAFIGLSLIFRRSTRPGSSEHVNNEDRVRGMALFGGSDIVSRSSHFTGAEVAAFFGGATLDLRQAHLAPEGAIIEVTTAFGGVDILVPRGWDVRNSGVPIFGGIENKTTTDEILPDAPRLTVRDVAVFGGIGIKHDR